MGKRPRKLPERGTASAERARTSLADALFPHTRQRVLALLFGQPDREFGVAEIIALAASGSGSVQRELERMNESGLITSAGAQRQRKYRANPASPVFDELRGIVEKTVGVAEVIRRVLSPLGDRILYAVLYGSVAKGSDVASSDIDVLLVSDDLALEDVFAALQGAERRLGRRVSPTMYTSSEFRRRRRANHPFLTKVLAGKHIPLIGEESAASTTG